MGFLPIKYEKNANFKSSGAKKIAKLTSYKWAWLKMAHDSREHAALPKNGPGQKSASIVGLAHYKPATMV
jgi:hypothetical protein